MKTLLELLTQEQDLSLLIDDTFVRYTELLVHTDDYDMVIVIDEMELQFTARCLENAKHNSDLDVWEVETDDSSVYVVELFKTTKFDTPVENNKIMLMPDTAKAVLIEQIQKINLVDLGDILREARITSAETMDPTQQAYMLGKLTGTKGSFEDGVYVFEVTDPDKYTGALDKYVENEI